MLRHIISGVTLACAALAAQAQTPEPDTTPPQNVQLQHQEIAKGDPARWYQADRTRAQHEHTLRKEIGAALVEARQACHHGPASERSACLKEAQATYQQDMAKLPQMVAQK